MNKITKLGEWLVYSSVNADKLSAAFKSFVSFLVIIVSNVALLKGNLNLNPADFQNIGESLIVAFQAFLTFISLAGVTIAGIRKLWHTYRGTNDVLNSYKV